MPHVFRSIFHPTSFSGAQDAFAHALRIALAARGSPKYARAPPASRNDFFPARIATESEVDEDPTVSRLVERGKKGRFLAFKFDRELPTGSNIEIVFPPGLPSAEGPKRATNSQAFGFRTYDPLRVSMRTCGGVLDAKQCRPGDSFAIQFNNPIDATKTAVGQAPRMLRSSTTTWGGSASWR